MGASATPILRNAAVTTSGVTITFGQAVGGAVLSNLGTETAFFAFGATLPTASLGNGRFGLKAGESVSVPFISQMQISFKTASGTASVQCVGIPGGSNNGGGSLAGPNRGGSSGTIDLSTLGINACTAGVEKIAGPIACDVALSTFSDDGWSGPAALADFMSVNQGDTSDSCTFRVDIELAVDGGTPQKAFSFNMVVTGGGGSGGGGVGVTLQFAKPVSVTSLKALGSRITSAQARCLLTKTSGSGDPTAAVDFSNSEVVLT